MEKTITIFFSFALWLGVFAQSDGTMFTGCDSDTPGWGSSLGTITRGTQEWTISGRGITQIWSDAVTATGCSKASFSSIDFSTGVYKADCRSNPDYSGDFFSWCAVVRFKHVLCPYPWRVPSVEDFMVLDIAMGGNGQNRLRQSVNGHTWQTQLAWYTDSNQWGGSYGGFSDPFEAVLWRQGTWAYYWSQSESTADEGFLLYFGTVGGIYPQTYDDKSGGLKLRCVR